MYDGGGEDEREGEGGVKMPPYPYRCPMFAEAYYNNMEIWRTEHFKPCPRCGQTPDFRKVKYKRRGHLFMSTKYEAFCCNRDCIMFRLTMAEGNSIYDLEYALNMGKSFYKRRDD